MSEDPAEPVQEQRPGEVDYATPPRRQVVGRSAIAALVLGIVSLSALLLGLCGQIRVPSARLALLMMGIVATIVAVPTAIVALRKAAKENGAGGKQARVGLALGSIAVFLLLMWVVLAHGVSRNRSEIDRIKCRGNLVQIKHSLMRYAQNNNGQFPQGFSPLLADIDPEQFVCPASNDQRAIGSTTQQTLADFARPGHCSYIYLGAGNSTSSVPKNFVLVYEPLDNHEKEGANFIFGDGNVEWLDAKEAKKLIDQLKSGVNPPRR